MGEQSGSRIGGDDYQHLYSWSRILDLLPEDSPYSHAWVEHPEAGSADDLTLHATEESGKATCFFQVKWHVDQRDRYSFARLVEPPAASKPSLLRKLYDSWLELRSSGTVEIWLVSNWAPDEHLGACIGDARMLRQSFFDSQPKPGIARGRDAWAASLEVSQEELTEFCRVLRFSLGEWSPNLESRVDETMKARGLRQGPEARERATCEIRRRIRQGGDAKRITRDELLRIIEDRDLREPPDDPGTRLTIHGWLRQSFDVIPTHELDWTGYFACDAGRQVPTPQQWSEALLPELRATQRQIANLPVGKYLDVRGKISLTASLVVGREFPKVGGWHIRAEQPTGGRTALWRSDATPSDRKFHVVAEGGSGGSDVAVCFAVTEQGRDALKGFVAERTGIDAWVYAEPTSGTGIGAVRHAADAVALAHSARQEIRSALNRYGATHVHLLLYGPAAFALFLGQELNAVGTVVTYEWVAGRYRESATLVTG